VNRLQSLRGSARSAYPDTALINGVQYALSGGLQQTLGGKIEEISGDFAGLVSRCYQSNAIVFAVEQARVNLFTEARFQWQTLRAGRPGDFFGNESLRILERPWPGGTTGDLLKYMLLDADFAGISFVGRPDGLRGQRLVRLRPDWVSIALGSQNAETQAGDVDAEFLGVVYHPGGRYSGRPPVMLSAADNQVAYFAPTGDPLRQLSGMPWLWPIIAEVMGDQAMTEHKLKFHEHGATPSLVVTTNLSDLTKLREWIALFEQNHEGTRNAYRSLYLGSAMDAKVLGSNMQQIDFAKVQGAGEVRIANAGGVPATVVGLSEGLAGSSLNAGNFGSAFRRFADLTMSPAWRNACGSLEQIVPPPPGARLWYDTRDIPALKDDIKSAAEVQALQSTAIRTLTDGGYDAPSVVDAIVSGDLKRLTHTGLLSVQLNPPNTTPAPTMPIVPVPDVPSPEDTPAGRALTETLGAMRALATREQPAPIVHFTASPITVNTPESPPVTVTIERGAVEISAPVTVTTPEITVNTPAVSVEPTPVTVEAHVEPTPVEVHNAVTVEPTPVTIENTIEAAQVIVEPTPITIENAVTVEPTPVEITNAVTVEPTPVSITNEIPAPRSVTKRIVRDAKNQITEIVEETTDG
jgi:hypothetical protein